jgi:Radical SAM superfamily/4Fe-4S single cluster domain
MTTPEDATPGPPALPTGAPPGFHLLAKPSGSTCNIDCTYCFFLSNEALYPNEKSRMSDETLETYIRQLLESHRVPHVTVAWQGGEPTLMKVEFFRRAVEIVEQYRRPGQIVQHTFQTNGILLDDDWCAFFKAHNFLVGRSVDGPRELHDTYRKDRGQKATFDKVMNGCPKDRFAVSRDGEPGQNYLCAGLELFFKHTAPTMREMAQLIQQRRYPADVMTLVAAEDRKRGPYQSCPCGSGLKFRFCHGTSKPRSQFNGVKPHHCCSPRFFSRRPGASLDGRVKGYGSAETEHPHPLGRRHRSVQCQRLQPRHDGLQDAQH